eukprot:scaffold58433_cov72-Phaeocystis_antarctica.AAC.1
MQHSNGRLGVCQVEQIDGLPAPAPAPEPGFEAEIELAQGRACERKEPGEAKRRELARALRRHDRVPDAGVLGTCGPRLADGQQAHAAHELEPGKDQGDDLGGQTVRLQRGHAGNTVIERVAASVPPRHALRRRMVHVDPAVAPRPRDHGCARAVPLRTGAAASLQLDAATVGLSRRPVLTHRTRRAAPERAGRSRASATPNPFASARDSVRINHQPTILSHGCDSPCDRKPPVARHQTLGPSLRAETCGPNQTAAQTKQTAASEAAEMILRVDGKVLAEKR